MKMDMRKCLFFSFVICCLVGQAAVGGYAEFYDDGDIYAEDGIDAFWVFDDAVVNMYSGEMTSDVFPYHSGVSDNGVLNLYGGFIDELFVNTENSGGGME